MVTVVTVAVVVALVAKVLVWAEAIINTLVEELVIKLCVDGFSGMRIIAVAVVATALEFAVTVSRSVDKVAVDVLINALADVMIAVLPAVGVADVLADVDVTILAVVMTVLDFTTSTPLEEEFGC